MRVVGGIWRGQSFDAPEGRDTRPTTDRTREAIASMILSQMNLDLSGASVLDLFAGSGAMGIELLSRGARHATFCERNRKTAALIKKNLSALAGRGGPWQVIAKDAAQLAKVATAATAPLEGAPFSIVFLDPPYKMEGEKVWQMVFDLKAAGLLSRDVLVVYEHAATSPAEVPAGVRVVKSRTRGISCVDLMRFEECA
ncbi:MAG: 16S rRNA (guanine(966)-N(2))-methyltransferase RsmD [Atopobiaceae bacterium]|jgi:16S rRNA (guanine966-N2)-methyltransferase